MPPAVQLFFCPEFQRPFPLSLFFIHRKTAIAAYIIYRIRLSPGGGAECGQKSPLPRGLPQRGWGSIPSAMASRVAAPVYKILFRAVPVIGSALGPDLVRTIGDTLNGLMAIPNFVALFALSPVVFKLTKEYFAKVDQEKK